MSYLQPGLTDKVLVRDPVHGSRHAQTLDPNGDQEGTSNRMNVWCGREGRGRDTVQQMISHVRKNGNICRVCSRVGPLVREGALEKFRRDDPLSTTRLARHFVLGIRVDQPVLGQDDLNPGPAVDVGDSRFVHNGTASGIDDVYGTCPLGLADGSEGYKMRVEVFVKSRAIAKHSTIRCDDSLLKFSHIDDDLVGSKR